MRELTDIQFYGAIEFASKVLSLGPKKVLEDKDTRELFYCHPLLSREVLHRKKRMALGKIKIENHPFDIVFVEEEDLKRAHSDKSFQLNDPIWIQVKEITDFKIGEQRIKIDRWLNIVQEYVDKVADKVKMQPVGNLHLHNRIHFEAVGTKELEKQLSGIKFKEPFPYKQTTISIECAGNDGKPWGIMTWQLHPTFWAVGTLSNKEDTQELRKIYGLEK